MVKTDLGRRRAESFSEHCSGQGLDLRGDRLIAKVEVLVLMEWPGQQHHALNMSFVHRLRLEASEEADLPGVLQHRLSVFLGCPINNLEVCVHKAWSIFPCSPEIKEAKLSCARIEEEIRPIWISLHVTVDEQLREAQSQDGGGDQVPGVLGQGGALVDGQAADVLRGQHLGC